LKRLRAGVIEPLSERLIERRARVSDAIEVRRPGGRWVMIVCGLALAAGMITALVDGAMELRTITKAEIFSTLQGAGATFLRVNAALLIASLWTIPVGVAIGFQPKLARIAQPLAQIAASVPATALFPVLLLALIKAGGGLGIGSILLMLLGTQWYVLFNVIAGAIAIPSDLREVAALYRFPRWELWRMVILPGIFPYLITGLVTASGGAWNASIVAEYFHFKGQVLSTTGLGAQISQATDSGNFDLLLLSTIVMAILVVSINRLVWRPLYRLAETKYSLG
jgi:NitT/TauT family transport system permease protein